MATGKIVRKTEEEIALIRESSILVSRTLGELKKYIIPGIPTIELDRIAEEFIRDNGGVPSFKNYDPHPDSSPPYPYTLCISVNEEVVHGLPSHSKLLKEGDIVSIDCGVFKNGFHGDSAYTFPVGEISPKKQKLLQVTKESLYRGIQRAVEGNSLGDVSNAIQMYAESFGYSVVREMVGHGIGKNLHEPPEVPNYGKRRSGPKLMSNWVIAIEPMINMGKKGISRAADEWTIFATDRLPSAHFEHTVVIREKRAEVLTTFEYIENV
ncbi:MAG: type I methionyl aminopeptidase [Bacteroidia bacterium]